MIQIRQGQFETNSSSSHSICIKDTANRWEEMNFKGKDLFIKCDEFHWGVDEFNDFDNKASYVATYIKNFSKEKQEFFENVIADYTGADNVIISPNYAGETEDKDCWGGIDHQSIDTAQQVMYSSEDLKNFLFNKESTLLISNDNGSCEDYE